MLRRSEEDERNRESFILCSISIRLDFQMLFGCSLFSCCSCRFCTVVENVADMNEHEQGQCNSNKLMQNLFIKINILFEIEMSNKLCLDRRTDQPYKIRTKSLFYFFF